MIRILVTGADGFIGRSLVPHLDRAGYSVLAAVRDERANLISAVQTATIGDIRQFTDWDATVAGVDAVIHLAARAHVTAERHTIPVAAFREVNCKPTIDLFEACQRAAVRRFVFVSSIGVNGVSTTQSPFTEEDLAAPVEPYAVSKWEAEQGLRAVQPRGSTQLVIVRPALTYGPHVKGNFQRLMRLIESGWPIPLGSLQSSRSILGITSLCDLLLRCVSHESASNQLFVAADQRPIQTKQLISQLSEFMNRRIRLLRIPLPWIKVAAKCAGKLTEVNRLIDSLAVDSSKARVTLGWQPASCIDTDMRAMVEAYRKTNLAAAQ